jgi:hypothetical protein
MPSITRRTFVETCAAVAATRQARPATAPDIHFPSAPRDRLAVASYPFRNFMDRPGHPGIKLVDFAGMVVEKFGIHNIEPLSAHFPSTEPVYLDELRRAVEMDKTIRKYTELRRNEGRRISVLAEPARA